MASLKQSPTGVRECQLPSAARSSGHVKLAPFEKGKANLKLNPSLLPPTKSRAHFGSKASFLRCDLQTLNYSRSYRKRRRKKRKESFAQRPNERTNWRTKLSIDQWKYSHSGDRQPRRGREGEDRTDTHVMYILRQYFLPRLRGASA